MIDNHPEQPPLVVNGRQYPMWSQFVQRKTEWIGGVLEDWDMGVHAITEITDITLKPNGAELAFFMVNGKEFDCGFCVSVGGVTAGEPGWITFSGYGGHTWRIKQPEKKT